jgi:hypothetical protein
MNYQTRQTLYDQITEIRKRPVITYVTSYRQNASASIAFDVNSEFIKVVQSIPNDQKEVDLILISHGGDPTVAYRIVTILRERFDKFSVLLPYTAYSAATLISMGADEIIMHPFSNLGPVDPQLTHRKQNNEHVSFGSEDLRNFIEFIKQDVGLSDQSQMQKSFELICKEIGAIPIGIAKRSSQLALTMGEKLLSMHMGDNTKAKSIAETLNKSFYHHGYPLGRKEAKDMGLNVINPSADIEKLLWDVYLSFEEEMQFNVPFDPVKIVLSSEYSESLLAPINQLNIPANLPEDVLNQMYNNILQQVPVVQIPGVDYQNYLATVEARHAKSDYRISGKIFAIRYPDGNLALNTMQSNGSWVFHAENQVNQAELGNAQAV